MTENTILWIIGAAQAVTIFLVGWIKLDIKDLWRRMYSHRHEIDCPNNLCGKARTGDVIVPHEGA